MKLEKDDVVLFLPAWYPNRNDRMLGLFVAKHAEALAEKVDVHILYVCPQKKLSTLFEFDQTGKQVIVYYRKPTNSSKFSVGFEGVLYAIATLLGYYKYRKLFKKPKFFHVHVLTRAAVLPYLLSLFSKTDYFITEHWSRYLPSRNTYSGWLRKWLTKKVVARSRGISTVSNALKTALVKHNLSHPNFPLISNVVTDEFFKTVIGEPNQIPKFIHVSGFEEKSKNITGMLNAFKVLEENGVKYKLNLIGNGIDFLEIKAFAKELDLKNVKFTGELARVELINEYESSDALVLFSNYENQPCVILEAQASALPVIATNVGGIPELVNHKNGILVEAKKYEELSRELTKFINGNYGFDRKAIRADAKLKYTKEVVAQQFLDFYQHNG